MNKRNLSRRGFMQRSLAALTVGAGLPAWYARECLAADEKKPNGNGDKIIMGAIGIGSPASRGRGVAHEILGAGRGAVTYVAVCDVDGRHRENAVNDLKKNRKQEEVKAYKDFRELLDRSDINAVSIATPDHWHALIAIDAMRKGKDVYCEKPLTLTITEGKAVAKVAKETGRIFQVGSQQRSDARFRLACELARNGRIGKIKRVETRIGDNPTSPPLLSVDPPKELDWDFWLGPTPKVDYMELTVERNGRKQYFTRCHYEFRWWYDYSGGKLTDWGAHHNDIAQWGLGMDGNGPVAVEGEGEEPAKEKNRYNCHPHFKVTYTYANGAKVVCSDGQFPGALDPKETRVKGRDGRERALGHGNGVLFVGEDDKWIFVNRDIITASDPKLIEEPLPSDATKLYVSNNHAGNFVECIRTRKPTICTADVGYRSVTVCHLGAIALRSGKKLKWDPKAERFEDEADNKWLSREMRSPWKLEV